MHTTPVRPMNAEDAAAPQRRSEEHLSADSDTPSTPTAVHPLDIRVNPVRFATWLLALITVLLLVGMASRTVIYSLAPEFDTAAETAPRLARLLSRFDLGFEPSLPAWYSSLALFWSCALLALIGHARSARRQPFWKHWYALSALFLLLAIDENVMLHEMFNNTLRERLQTSGAFYFAWVIPAIAFVACVGLGFLRFLLNLPRRTRWLFIVSGGLFVGGAVGVEMIEGVMQTRGMLTTHLFTVIQAVEEGLEMIGVALFLFALLDHIGREFGLIAIHVSQGVKRPHPVAASTDTGTESIHHAPAGEPVMS